MKSVVICGDRATDHNEYTAVDTVDVVGVPVTVGLVDTEQPIFDLHAPENRSAVLIKVRAFSCNYRDKSIILAIHRQYREYQKYTSIGSEFAAEVIATGPDVTRFQVGDRVMADNHYLDMSARDFLPGIPSNSSSRRYRVLHEAKLIKIPPEMSDEVAAAFSLGAQTSYSIVRKLQIQQNAYMLITAATSSTALFVIQALRRYNLHLYATTASNRREQDLVQLGVRDVISVDPTCQSFRENPQIAEIMQQKGGFDYVFDPFSDLYLSKAIDVIAMEGKYITCGFADQYSHLTEQPMYTESKPFKELMPNVIAKNIQIIGNCLGYTEDLKQACEDYTTGALDIVIDSVFRGNQVAAFFDRTYNARDRFGKVVYCYSD